MTNRILASPPFSALITCKLARLWPLHFIAEFAPFALLWCAGWGWG